VWATGYSRSIAIVWEHHPSHFWLVFAAAAISAWLALAVDRAARHHGDARLLLVGLGFLAAALFFGLHALATPGVLLDHANGGFALATPAGLALSAMFGAAAALDMDGAVGGWALRSGRYLRYGLIGIAAVWAIVSLTGLPPLADPEVAHRGSSAVVVLVVVVPLPPSRSRSCSSRSSGCATPIGNGSSSPPTTRPPGSRSGSWSWPSASASPTPRTRGSPSRCRRTSWRAGRARPGEAVAKALRTLREHGQLTTGRRTMTLLDLDGLRRRAGRS
jgi:hypothetical protein